MSAVLQEQSQILVNAGVVPATTNVFWSTKAAIPTSGGPLIQLIQVGGVGSEFIQNDFVPAWVHASTQVVTRGPIYSTTEAMAWAAWHAFAKVRNLTVNGTRYQRTIMQHPPVDSGMDDTRLRIMFKFTFISVKRPS
jgi:hypothetical protein